MKLFDEQGTQVGEIEKPEPVEQDGVWYEAVEVKDNLGCVGDKQVLFADGTIARASHNKRSIRWVMRPIPRATPEQLKAIGMRERDDRPMPVKESEVYVGNDGLTAIQCIGNSDKHRWILVPVEKKEVHTSERSEGIEQFPFIPCPNGSKRMTPADFPCTCDKCIDEGIKQSRKNYTAPSPAPIHEKGLMICNHAGDCPIPCEGKKPHQPSSHCAKSCIEFKNVFCIPYAQPAPKDDPRLTVGEIENILIEQFNKTIEAVTNRNKKENHV